LGGESARAHDPENRRGGIVMAKLRAVVFFFAVETLLLGMAPHQCDAQTWTGTVNGNWNNAGNWTGGIPASSFATQLTFGATSNAAMTDDIPGTLSLKGMTFNAGAPS